ncbi:MAG TPA: hypothetical protein VGL71_01415, partial [Urbifossiella sp.]
AFEKPVITPPPPAPAATIQTPAAPVAEPIPDAADSEIFFGDESLDEITHGPTAGGDELELGIESQPEPVAASHKEPVSQVIEATEPSVASALSLNIAETTPAESEPFSPSATEASLSDTSFGRQVEEFASQSPDPIVEEVGEREDIPAEIEETPVEEASTAETPIGETPVEEAPVEEPPIAEGPAEELPWDAPAAEAEIPSATETELPPLQPADAFASVEPPAVSESTPIEETPLNWDEAPLIAETAEPATESPATDEPRRSLFADRATASIDPDPEAAMEAIAPADAFVEPEVESTATAPFVVPGMPLDLSTPLMPDFVSGLPLVLEELPAPPASFGKVQVGFGEKNVPRSRIDSLRDKSDEVGPFDNLQIDIDNPVPLASPTPVPEAPLDDLEMVEPEPVLEDVQEDAVEELPASELEFESEPVMEAPVEEVTLTETPAEVEELPAEEALAPEIELAVIEPPVAEPEAIIPEPEAPIAAEPPSLPPLEERPKGKGLFQSKLRIPPPPRRMRLEPQDEQPQIETPAGFETPTPGSAFGRGGFGQGGQAFSGLVGGTGGSADVFSQGFSADLSSDPVFGNAVKPVAEEAPVQPTRRKAPTPARPGRRPMQVTPADEVLAEKLANDLGAPVVPSAPEQAELAKQAVVGEMIDEPQSAAPVLEEEPIDLPVQAEAAAPTPVMEIPARQFAPRRSGKRVAVLLALMVISMVAAALVIYNFCEKRIAFTGSISYQNFGRLQQAEQRRLQESQKSLLVSERLRDVAVNDFRSHHLDMSPGFLGSAEAFARNETRVHWIESKSGGGYDTLVYRYEG